MYRVARLLCDTRTDVFSYANEITNAAIGMLDAHVDNAAIIGFTIEGGVYFDAPFAELLSYIPREGYVRAALVRGLYDGVVFVCFVGHGVPRYGAR